MSVDIYLSENFSFPNCCSFFGGVYDNRMNICCFPCAVINSVYSSNYHYAWISSKQVNQTGDTSANGNLTQGKTSAPQENIEKNEQKKSKIWRPFSPTPSTPRKSSSRNILKQNMFFSIKPSNVKIGASKTCVFKAVKKNAYSQSSNNSHMKEHAGQKAFRCDYPRCFKSFARNEELTRHKRIHSGYKPHACLLCSKRFGRKDHLSKHLKTHLQASEKKIYLCSVPGCGHRYSRSDALTRHKSTAHI